jgi:hypothetical protein
MAARVYRETFDDGPGGWFGWIDNARGPRALETRASSVITRSPWWIDYNHAPPGAGYLHMLATLMTRGPFGEHLRETAGENRFAAEEFPLDLTQATMTLRARGELLDRGAQVCLLLQSIQAKVCSGWMLTGRPFQVATEWTTQSITLDPDPSLWTCLGSRHDRTDFYGTLPLEAVLQNVNVNLLLTLFPLDVVPMGPIDGDPDRLRPERDYPVWRSRLPEGWLEIDEITIAFAEGAA